MVDQHSVEQRIAEVVAAMTPAEKAGQLTQLFHFGAVADGDPKLARQPAMVEELLAEGRVGALLFVSGVREVDRLQRLAFAGNRHGIGALFGFDVIHGLRTIHPVPIAMAASWDPAVAEAAQTVAAREARAVGLHWTFAPMVDIARDPRWGRMIEGAGEDPFLGAAMAAAQVRGFQGPDGVRGTGAPDRVIAGPKHFAGYGYGLGGRDYDEVDLSDAELRNVVLPPFAAAIAAGAGNVMTAYMALNGVPATGNRWLFTDVLRDELGFDGFTVSDANAVRSLVTHGFAADPADAAARAVHAGTDVEMAIADPAYAHLVDALADGRLDEADLDAAVTRVLRAKAAVGLLDPDPYPDPERAAAVLADPAHREVARDAARRSAVLLTNRDVAGAPLLPLDADGLSRVAVIGPLADSRRDTLGPWVFDHDLDETVTVLAGITDHLGDRAVVEFAPGVRPARRLHPSLFDNWPGNVPEDPAGFDDDAELDRAAATAAATEVAIVVVGEWQHMIGENASRSSLGLPGRQSELLERVVATGTPTVVVIMNGRPLEIGWAVEHAGAILDVWYPGTAGGHAVADLLFGDAVPGGKLPFTWPRSVGQVPLVYSRLTSHEPENAERRYWDADGSPLFRFGHGLSYTSFAFDELVAGDGRVSVRVTNTGDRAGSEVAQLYVHQRAGRAARPVRELKGFRRLELAAGASQIVEFDLGPDQLRYWSAAERDWVVDPGTFDVWVGGSSTADLHTEITLT